MSTAHRLMTAKELLRATELGRCELIRGELHLMSPAGYEHGVIVGRIHTRLDIFVSGRGLGDVTGAETGFHIEKNPDTVRAPDVGLMFTENVPKSRIRGFFPGAPDLAVEVLSPDDHAPYVAEKVKAWLEAGSRSVWVFDPKKLTATVHRAGKPQTYGATEILVDADLLPGFQLDLREIYR